MESKVGLFAAAAAFGGHRAGWVFKHGSQGLGYYADVGSFAAAQAATEEDFLRKYAVATAGPSNEAAANVASTLHTDQHSQNEPTLDPDAPIVAALASHSDALDEVDRATAQLERELAENSWLTIPADPDILFHTPSNERWQRATEKLGFHAWQLGPGAGHA